MGPSQVQRFLTAWIQGTDMIQYTPGGFAWSSAWGSLRYTANAALIAMVYAGHINGDPLSFAFISRACGPPESRGAMSCAAAAQSGSQHKSNSRSLGQTAGYQLFQEGGMVRLT